MQSPLTKPSPQYSSAQTLPWMFPFDPQIQAEILHELLNVFYDLPASAPCASALPSSCLPPTPLHAPARHSCTLSLKSSCDPCTSCLLCSGTLSSLFFSPSTRDQALLSCRRSSLTSPLRLSSSDSHRPLIFPVKPCYILLPGRPPPQTPNLTLPCIPTPHLGLGPPRLKSHKRKKPVSESHVCTYSRSCNPATQR